MVIGDHELDESVSFDDVECGAILFFIVHFDVFALFMYIN